MGCTRIETFASSGNQICRLSTAGGLPSSRSTSAKRPARTYGFHPAGVVYFAMVMNPELCFWGFTSVPLGIPKPVVTALTGTLGLVQSAHFPVEDVLELVVIAAAARLELVLELVVIAATATLEVVDEVQSSQTIDHEDIALDAEVDTSIAATGAEGFEEMSRLGVAETVIVLTAI